MFIQKLKCFILVIVLILVPGAAVYAVPDTAITVSGTLNSTENGDEITVSIDISNNPGIAAYKFLLWFDKEALTPASVDRGLIMTSGDFVTNMDKAPNLTTLDFVQVAWMNMYDSVENGTIYKITFNVNPDASGDTEFRLTYDPDDIINMAWDNVSFTATEKTVIPLSLPPYDIKATTNTLAVLDEAITGNLAVNVTNNEQAIPVMVIAVIADGSNKIVYSKIISVEELGLGNTPFNLGNINFPSADTPPYELKLMLWTTNPYMQPLTTPSPITI